MESDGFSDDKQFFQFSILSTYKNESETHHAVKYSLTAKHKH